MTKNLSKEKDFTDEQSKHFSLEQRKGTLLTSRTITRKGDSTNEQTIKRKGLYWRENLKKA